MGTRHCRRPPLGFNVERLLMRVEIVEAQGVLPQALCVVIAGWPEAGVGSSLGCVTGWQHPERKTTCIRSRWF